MTVTQSAVLRLRRYTPTLRSVGMTAPASIVSIVTWLRHPFQGKKTEVKINRLSVKEYLLSFVGAIGVTVAFYFILRALNTANLVWSTVSVLTSLYASYLNIRRSPAYALAYCTNDGALMVLWLLLSLDNPAYICMVVCFAAFLANDAYAFINWMRMHKKQNREESLP